MADVTEVTDVADVTEVAEVAEVADVTEVAEVAEVESRRSDALTRTRGLNKMEGRQQRVESRRSRSDR